MATLQDLQELFAHRAPHNVAIEISGFTSFRTTCIEDLTPREIDLLYACHVRTEKTQEEDFDAFRNELILKAWRSKVLAAAEKAHLKDPGSFDKFNGWMLHRSRFKKPFTAHTSEELKELHRQVKAAQTNNRKSAGNPLTQAWWKKGETLITQN